jgi:hypothetical protein
MNFKKHYGYPWKTVREFLSHLNPTATRQNQDPHDVQIKGNGQVMFYEIGTGYGSQVLIRYYTE